MKITELDLFGISRKGFYILKAKVEFKTKNSPVAYIENRALLAFYIHKDFIYAHFLFKTKRIDF